MLTIKPNHKAINDYYKALEVFAKQGISHETAIKNAFQAVLSICCKQMNLDFIEEYPYKRLERYKARIDGAFLDSFRVPQGYLEAKDSQDDLGKEVKLKFEQGYPRDNIIFQSPDRAIIYQGSTLILDEDITSPVMLTSVLKELFHYKTDIQLDWEQAVEEFKMRIPESAELIIKLIEEERRVNKAFIISLDTFANLCRTSINPNISLSAIEEMLVQHLLTERIFRKVFENSDFVNRNIIASEIDKVITSLTSRKFNRNDFLKPLDRFYNVLEKRALEITDFSIKQAFLNTVYEKFFQGFAVKQADTMGIVYTPQPMVGFMLNSIEEILIREFGLSLSAPNVHFLDPFTGTGNFVISLIRKTNKTDLKYKYLNEIHCNEIMLLPYYIASMNIEHEYYEITGEYLPFPGICLVDTFQLAEDSQISMFSEENTERVEKLKRTPIFVYVSNPPYNAGQVNENDNNKNRKYPILDKRVSETFAKDSKATNKNMLQDPYIKAFRFAMDKVIENGEGIVSFVSNNSYIDAIALDGMRKHIYENFDLIYVVDLKGNIRKDSMRDGIPLGEKHTVFGLGAMVGIAIIFLVKKKHSDNKILNYAEVDFRSTREEKFKFLEKGRNIYNLPLKELTPDAKNNWLNEGMDNDFDSLLPMDGKNLENGLFSNYSRGVGTSRDSWAYNCDKKVVEKNMSSMIEIYNDTLIKYHKLAVKPDLDSFVINDETKISWSNSTKTKLLRGSEIIFSSENLRTSIYRPFYKQNLYFDKTLNNEGNKFFSFIPLSSNELENRIISVCALGNNKPFHSLMVDKLPDLHLTGDSQCFPFYTYKEDGTDRKENISDWALKQYQEHYKDESITKWDIFYYIYAVLHTPAYKEKYAANLRRSLPRIPFLEDFRKYSTAGKKLTELHVNYEEQKEYYLQKIEAPGKQLDWKVVKMKLSKDKQTLIYNDFLSMTGIPYEVYDYKLGNRSALEWIIDQYQIKTDKRSGIVNDPNREDEPDYIVRLIGKIVTVSLETVKIVREL